MEWDYFALGATLVLIVLIVVGGGAYSAHQETKMCDSFAQKVLMEFPAEEAKWRIDLFPPCGRRRAVEGKEK